MAMENGSLSASDVALLSGNNGFGFGNNGFEGLIYLAVIASMFGGGWGGFGFGGGAGALAGNLATQNDVQRGFDALNLQNQSRDILAAVSDGTAQAVAATNQAKYDNINVAKDIQTQLQAQLASIAVTQANAIANQNQCCCDTKQLIQTTAAETNANIAQNRYESAMNTAAINANTTAQTQKILDAISQNKIEGLQAQISQLQLQNAMNGVLRFPNSWTYGAGPFPPIFGCCGQNNV